MHSFWATTQETDFSQKYGFYRKLVLPCSSKKSTYERIEFLPKPQKPHFRVIFGTVWALLTREEFFLKNWAQSLFFLYDSLTLCKKSEKN